MFCNARAFARKVSRETAVDRDKRAVDIYLLGQNKMFENSAVRRNPKANSRCTSVSTIDSVLAAELAREYDSCQEFPKFQTDASPPRAQNNMTFDKSEGIHVGDVINYYYQSPSIEGKRASLRKQLNCV